MLFTTNTTGLAMIVQIFDLFAQLYIFGSIALVLILFFDHLFSSLSLLLDEHNSYPKQNQGHDFYDQIKSLFRYDNKPEQLTNPSSRSYG
jgi:hypothetical protein